jgi:repressor LexA
MVLYNRQRQILNYLNKFISDNGFAPTIREIGEALGLSSPATVEEHLHALERKGVIRRTRGRKRAITVNPHFSTQASSQIPVLGQIAAGYPLEAIEQRHSFVEFPAATAGTELYGLLVRGDSLAEDGIFSGDLVIVQKQEVCANGDLVVALLEDNTATLKRCYRESDRIRLQPANAQYQPIYVRNLRIQGKVIGLVRRF